MEKKKMIDTPPYPKPDSKIFGYRRVEHLKRTPKANPALKAWLDKYDVPNAIVLLEGKRNVLDEDIRHLESLGSKLVHFSKHITFRSGNTSGADYHFSKGVSSVDKNRLEVITPFNKHRDADNMEGTTHSIEDFDFANAIAIIEESKQNIKTEKLIDKYVAGDINRITLKAAYIIRDTIKVMGFNAIPPATFAIFYDDLQKPKQGGTGYTMLACLRNNVPYVDQRVWKGWL